MLISFLYEAFLVMFGRKLLHIHRLLDLNLSGICWKSQAAASVNPRSKVIGCGDEKCGRSAIVQWPEILLLFLRGTETIWYSDKPILRCECLLDLRKC